MKERHSGKERNEGNDLDSGSLAEDLNLDLAAIHHINRADDRVKEQTNLLAVV